MGSHGPSKRLTTTLTTLASFSAGRTAASGTTTGRATRADSSYPSSSRLRCQCLWVARECVEDRERRQLAAASPGSRRRSGALAAALAEGTCVVATWIAACVYRQGCYARRSVAPPARRQDWTTANRRRCLSHSHLKERNMGRRI